MKLLTHKEMQCVSGAASVQAQAWAATIILVGASVALGTYLWNRYYQSIDFSKLSPEEAYQKGLNDAFALGYMFK